MLFFLMFYQPILYVVSFSGGVLCECIVCFNELEAVTTHGFDRVYIVCLVFEIWFEMCCNRGARETVRNYYFGNNHLTNDPQMHQSLMSNCKLDGF